MLATKHKISSFTRWANSIIIFSLLFLSAIGNAADQADESKFRKFTDALGESYNLKLLSHKGDGTTVRVQREDGREFNAPLQNFCAKDQEYVQQWMSKTPPEIQYSLGYEFDRDKVGRSYSDYGYKRVDKSNVAYTITITNKSRVEVGPLVLKYRLYVSNMTEGYLYHYDAGMLVFGEELKPKETLKYSESMTVTTQPVKLDKVQYDYYSRARAKDAVLGILLRVYDSYGRLIDEVRSKESSARSLKWVDKVTK